MKWCETAVEASAALTKNVTCNLKIKLSTTRAAAGCKLGGSPVYWMPQTVMTETVTFLQGEFKTLVVVEFRKPSIENQT